MKAKTMIKLRPNQQEILKYRGGKMGVAAVPGSGKTFTLSMLAARLITEGCINDDQEVLIVTLVNSAVDNFSRRIAGFIAKSQLLPNVGYRVRTLHGLAHDIVRERPDLAGLSEHFSILDETETARMIEANAAAYLRVNSDLANTYVDPSIDLNEEPRTKKAWFDAITTLNANFISQAKDLQIQPDEMHKKMQQYHLSDPLLDMALWVYTEYQRGLHYRGAVDFSDLVSMAERVLVADSQYLDRLRYRWPYVLEDEAQDSSKVQEKVLRLLTGANGNWVRMGDTNQAIYESFTTASPTFLRNFMHENQVIAKDLPDSGRSNKSIISLANSLITWSQKDHPVEELRGTLGYPLIVPVSKDDGQKKPDEPPTPVFIMKSALTSEQEITKVVDSIKSWLPGHQDKSVAVLCPIGAHAEKVVEALQAQNIKIVEMLKSTQSTRRVTRLLEKILAYLADPASVNKFSVVFQLIAQEHPEFDQHKAEVSGLLSQIKKVNHLEEILYPRDPGGWKITLPLENTPQWLEQDFARYLDQVRRWHEAAPLPIDQLLLTIASDLYTAPQDLALTHKLALLLDFNAQNHPTNGLTEFAVELGDIASNDRKFAGFSDDDTGFDPDQHKGEVLVTTFHKAKGLEWDRVYLLSVNNYDFPSAQEYDEYKGEKWFILNRLNLEAELLAKLKALVDDDIPGMFMEAGIATRSARLEYAAERLRLLYVGITRARESLVITWNTGRKKDSRMALPLEALHAIVEKSHAAA